MVYELIQILYSCASPSTCIVIVLFVVVIHSLYQTQSRIQLISSFITGRVHSHKLQTFGKGFGFLSFESEESINKVVAEHYVNINGKQVIIKLKCLFYFLFLKTILSSLYYVFILLNILPIIIIYYH